MVQIPVKKDFIESNEEGFAQKRDNFLQKAPQYIDSGVLPKDISDALIAELQEDEASRDKKNRDKKTAHDSRLAYVSGHKKVEKSLRDYKKAIDNNSSVTTEIKQELGLLGNEKMENSNNKKPDLKGRVVGGIPHLSFTRTPMDGIMLYSKINDGDYDFQTSVKGSSFDDTRPRLNPKVTEIREYYAYYMYNGKKVGKQSEIVRVVLNPIE